MQNDAMYHDEMRRLQDVRDTRRIADRLTQVTVRPEFSDEDRAFIESRALFFIATADTHGHPDCSYRGGLPGFVRILDERTLMSARLRSRIMTVTACTDRWTISWQTHTLGCCSSISREQREFESTV